MIKNNTPLFFVEFLQRTRAGMTFKQPSHSHSVRPRGIPEKGWLKKGYQTLWAIFICLTMTAAQADEIKGAWSEIIDWPLISIHSLLAPDGRVLTFGSRTNGKPGGHLHYDVWDPTLGTGVDAHHTLDNKTASDFFCAAQLIQPSTGKVIIFGGDTRNLGGPNNLTVAYQPETMQIVELDTPMAYPRWYPTSTTLQNGNILIQGGIAEWYDANGIAFTPELWVEGEGWRSLFGAMSETAYGTDENRWWYPRSWVIPDGRVFGVTGTQMYYFDPVGDGQIHLLPDTFPGPNHGATSTAVMYRPGFILQVGGGAYGPKRPDDKANAAAAATIIDVTGDRPRLTEATPMHRGRHWGTATVLPNGHVLVVGGSLKNNQLEGVAHEAEIWNPVTNQWQLGAKVQLPRLYHSTALLLPDASVLVAGGGARGPLKNLNAEIYYPPYLYAGTQLASRPKWRNVPSDLDYQVTFTAKIQSDQPIQRVTLIKTGSVTHSFDMEQRFIELDFSRKGNTLTISGPPSPTIATPGYYLLFALDDAGVPSVGAIVRVGQLVLSQSQ